MTKKTLLALVATIMCQLLWAQGVAVFNSKQVFDAMPEKAQAEATLQQASDKLQAEFRIMQDEFNRKYADYQALDANTPATIRERRIQELQQADKEIRDFQARAQQALDKQREQLMAPIQQLIDAALREVGDEAGYSVILDVAKTAVPYVGPNTPDVTAAVKAKLNL